MTRAAAKETMAGGQQLLLDLGPLPAPTLANFIGGRNQELVAALGRLAAGDASEPLIYLWGENGSGRSHLLRALGALPGARYVSCRAEHPELAWDPSVRLWAVDDVDAADADTQVALFNLVNEVRGHPGAALVSAGPAAPLQLDLREDLRTRLGWGLVFRAHALDDAEKDAALARHAGERSLALAPDVRRYLLTHFERDMPALMRMVDALDRYALERQRPITLPLVRDWVQHQSASALQPDNHSRSA